MSKVAFIVDSSSGIKNGEIENVFVIPLIITKNENGKTISLKDQVDIDDKTLCELVNSGADIGTSQPSPGEMMQLVNSIYDKYDQIFVLPIHPKLSGAINSWRMVKEDYDKLHVITSYSLSTLTKYYVEYFLNLAKKEELTEQKVTDYIESTKNKWTGFLIVPNITQLVKGGRVSSFKSVLIKMLNLKLIISYDHNGLIFMDKSPKYEGCVEKIKEAFEKRIQLSKHRIVHSVLLENSMNEKYHIDEILKLLRKEFKLENVKTGKFPSVITAHTGVDYAAIILLVD